MNSRARLRAAFLACVFGCVAGVGLYAAPAQQKDAKKLDKDQMKEAQALADAIEWAQAGRPLPGDIPLSFETCLYFKSANGQTYVPFTLTLDPAKVGTPNASFLLRVIKKGAQPVAAKEQKKDTASMSDRPVNDLNDLRDMNEENRAKAESDKNKKPAVAPASYEDLEFLAMKPDQPQMSRAFVVPAGDYDVYIAVKDRPADKKQKARITVFKKEVSVPDFAQAELATSSIVLAEKLEPLQAPLKADQQRENPYTLGMLQMVPKIGTGFAKAQDLNVYFQIYNTGVDAAKKPDVLVEWEFFQKQQAGGEKKVFNTDPTVLNASTLPASFDVAKHTLAGASGWPLASFPAGEYRLQIKVTDKVSGKTLTHSVTFTVA